jgi:hypothetical protein
MPMKMFKTIIQNVISGLVGGLLVMSSANAQKVEDGLDTLRTRKLEIIDSVGKVRATFDTTGEEVSLVLTGGDKSLIVLSSSPLLSQINAVNPTRAAVHTQCGESSTICAVTQESASVQTSRQAHMFVGGVDKDGTTLECCGKLASLKLFDEQRKDSAVLKVGPILFPNDVEKVARLDLKLGTDLASLCLPKNQ